MVNSDVSGIGNTPIRPEILKQYLAEYPFNTIADEIYVGFKRGFDLHYSGPRISLVCPNLKSIRGKESIAFEIAMKEVRLGRVAGPFSICPLPNLRVSPVGLVPKKDGSWRLIHHLSYPNNFSVNDFIDQKFCTVQYTSFDSALAMLANLGRGAIAARLDIKSAFRLLPISPSDFELLGFKISDHFFIDKCLPFGCSLSCNLFEKFATFLEWELKRRANTQNVLHYIDDFLLAGRANTNECENLMACYSAMCEQFGVPLAPEKTIGPDTTLTFLGLEIDTFEMSVRIPAEKLDKLSLELENLSSKKKTTLKQLQSLTGILIFCCGALPAGRAFIRRFYDAMTGLSKPYHHVRITDEIKQDINIWLYFLKSFNGSTKYSLPNWHSDDELELFTDSAGQGNLGCSAIFKTHWAFMKWPLAWQDNDILQDISFLELVPIVMAIHIWGSCLTNKRVILHTDNKALVSILNKRSSKSKRVMRLIRPLVYHCLMHNIQYRSVHVPGKFNVIADLLSRQEWSKFHLAFRNKDNFCTKVPHSFLELLSGLEVM